MDIATLSIKVESKGVDESSRKLDSLGNAAAKAEGKVTSFIAAMSKLEAANKVANQSSMNFTNSLQRQLAALQTIGASLQANSNGTASLAASMAMLAASLNALNLQSQNATRSQRGHNEAMREAHALARGLSGSLGALWVTYGNLAGMAAGLAIGVAMKGIVSVGKDVENTLEGIRVRGEETTGSVNKMREALYNLSTGIYGPREVAKAFDTLILAGLKAEEAMVGIKDALNLATVGGTSIEKSSEVLVQVATAMGYTANNFGRIGDVIAKTAAVSIASVESISESFKSGSVVGKLYGQSLEDIGTQIAILSNLGIKNTAAGTSIKNFFSDLASGTDKVTKGLGMIGLKISDLQKGDGSFKSFVDVMKIISEHMDKLTMANQKYVQTLITNERGNKLMTEGLDLIRKKGVETGTALEDIFKRVTESYGFAAEGAAAMALTTDAQLKSIKNTIETQFAKTLKDIEPQISLVSQRLKEAFNSPEFSNGLASLAMSVANLTVLLVENGGAVLKLVEAFAALKVATTVVGALTAVGVAIDALIVGFKEARLAAMAFQVSLGILGVALTAAAAAWVYYNQKKEESFQSDKARAALAYMDDFKNKLDEENDRLQKQLELMKQNKTAAEALQEAQVAQQVMKVHDQGKVIVDEATKKYQEAWKNATGYQRDVLNDFIKKGAKPMADDGAANQIINSYLSVVKAQKQAADMENSFTESLKKHKQIAKEIADIEEARAQANKPTGGTGTIPPKEDKAAINAAYAAAIKKQAGIIREVEDDLSRFEEAENARYKTGEISKIKMIQEVAAARINALDVERQAIEVQIDLAKKKKNGEGDVQQFQNDLAAKTRAITAATAKEAEDISVIIAGYAKENTKTQIAELEAQGQYVKAATLRWGSDYSYTFKQLEKIVQEYGNTYPAVVEQVENLRKAQNTMIREATFKEKSKELEASILSVGNAMRSVVSENEDRGIGAMWNAATEASKVYKQQIDDLANKQRVLSLESFFSGNPNDMKRAEEVGAQIKVLTNHYKTMWDSVGKSIGDTLEGAFGKGGKALGNLMQTTLKYKDAQDDSSQSALRFWGETTSAAAGFFDEHSKGYAVMQRMSQAFHLAQLAQNAVEMASNIPTAFTKAAAQMGPWGIAAMAAAFASVGISAWGGVDISKQRQESQGTGTVFGDATAKTDSIAKSLTILKDNSNETMPISQGMLAALNNIQSGIGALGNLLVRSGAMTSTATNTLGSAAKAFSLGIGGFIGNTLGKIGNAIFGGNTSVQDTGFTMSSSTLASILANGVNASQFTDTKTSGGLFRSDKYSSTSASLGDEANSQFALIIANFAKGITAASDALGVGGRDFLQHLNSFVVDIGKISLKGMTGDEIQKTLQAVFSKLGDDMAKYAFAGLADFQKVGEGYFETFVRVANGVEQANSALMKLNITAIKYTDISNKQGDVATEIVRQSIMATEGMSNVGKMIEVFSGSLTDLTSAYKTLLDIRGLIKSTGLGNDVSESIIQGAGGTKELSQGLSTYFDKFFTDAEKTAINTAKLSSEFSKLGFAMPTSIKAFRDLVTSIGTSTPAAAKLTGQLLNLADAFAQIHSDDIQKVKDQGNSLLSEVDNAFSVLQRVVKAEQDVLNARITKEKALVDTLRSALDSMTAVGSEMADRAKAQAQIKAALAIVRAGGPLPDADSLKKALGVVTKDASTQFATMQEYLEDFYTTKNDISDLNGYAEDALSVDQQQLDALNQMLKDAQHQIDLLKGIDTNGINAVQALEALRQAIANAQANPYVGSSEAINAAYQSALGRAPDSAGMEFWKTQAANGVPIGDIIGSINNSPEAAIRNMYQSILGRTPDAAGLNFWLNAAANGTSLTDISKSIASSKEKIPGFAAGGNHAGGIRMVGEDGPEVEVTGPSRIYNARETAAMLRQGGSAEVVAEIKELRKDMAQQQQTLKQMASKIKRHADLFEILTEGGDAMRTKAA